MELVAAEERRPIGDFLSGIVRCTSQATRQRDLVALESAL